MTEVNVTSITVEEDVTRITLTTSPTNVVIQSPGPQGPPGADGSPGARYEHIQSAPSSTWVINHNLGFYPISEILISNEPVDADIAHNSVNSLTVTFPSPQTGRVELA